MQKPIYVKCFLFYWGEYTLFKRREYLEKTEYLLFDSVILRIEK